MRVYCNAQTVVWEKRRHSLFMRDATVGRTYAWRKDDGRYICVGCGKPVPVAW